MDDKQLKRLTADAAQLLHLTPQQSEYLGSVIGMAYALGSRDGFKEAGDHFLRKKEQV